MEYTALVTGADHGVGLALTVALLKRGCRVFAGRYNAEEVALEKLHQRFGDRLTLVPLDIGSDGSVREAAAAIKERTGRIDILINNAGILGDIEATIMDELNYDEMLKVFNVNALGALRVTQALAPLVLNSTAKLIVNLSSEAGSIGQNRRDSWFAYCMSKAALNIQSSLVHNGLKKAGVQVMILHPGWVQTYMRGKLDADAEWTPAQSAENIIARIMERIGRNEENGLGIEEGPRFIDAKGKAMLW
ncbi:SDR family oxidoreductase [Paenibacillus sp. M1]|uniref:SDR family oxidoreductase n=1 Tax=Paenibacillus haidiansis TaxID=1574488 RepID=A0ABU7VMA7_9BACL